MTDRILPLAAPHSRDCPVCGGDTRVLVAPLRWRGMPSPWASRIVPCPLLSGSDALRSVLAGDRGVS